MTVNQVYRISHVFNAPTADGDMIFNTHYRVTGVVTDTNNAVEGAEVAQEAGDVIAASYMSQLSDVVSYVETRYIGVSDPLVGGSIPRASVGNTTSEPVSWRSCPVVALKTGLRGRSYNGRIFLIAPPESQQNGGVLIAGQLTALQGVMASLLSLTGTVSGNTYDMTIYSPTLSGPTGPILDNIVANAVVRSVMGTQRSRQEV